MGVLNVTPDSFSDGGRWCDADAAVAHGRQLVAEGADIVDVGGESTRPGADPVDATEELRRVLPVVEALAPLVTVSIDTTKPEVAVAAVAVGASIVNDVSGSPALAEVAGAAGAGWIAMHMQGRPRTMQEAPAYTDVVAEVRDHLLQRVARAADLGVSQVWIDPGIGFGKTAAHNLSLLRHLDTLVATGIPVVVGTSRKSFLGALHGRTDGGSAAPPDDRAEGSIATVVWAAQQGAAIVRVHDVAITRQALRIVQEPIAEGPTGGAPGAGARR